ncbi:MAG: c-type cytochrome [Rubrivivax sp.]|nr:c-type cytochrome [Rubrivivax sp.]
MSSCPDRLKASVALLGLVGGLMGGLFISLAAQAQSTVYPGLGRAATPKEVQAWDIDVRPDFKGLPKGSGSVSRGQDVWEAKCASCHGVFGESNEVFSPLVGGTTKDDVKTGRVARLTDGAYPGRTTLMKVPTLSTLWDYINRAMPWNAPKSLQPDEVYAVTAFLLNLGGVVPDNYTLSDANMAQTQALLPNRKGMQTDHGLWPGRSLGNGGKPDVKATACMNNCATEATVASFLPDFARNAHGNLAEQNRLVGAQRGADTTRAPGAAPAAAAAAAPAVVDSKASAAQALARKHNCLTCHGMDNKVVGPGLKEVATRYAGRGDAVAYLTQKIREGGGGVWGPIPMPVQTLSADDAKAIAQWLADGMKR